jgi:RNA-directed DNA polymerase
MCAQKTPVAAAKVFKKYPIDQSRLYKVGSPTRLADLLFSNTTDLVRLCLDTNYKVFAIRKHIDKFSGKVKKKRVVQEPKTDLRRVHDRILYLLHRIELPGYVHAAVKGRSYRSNALAHKEAGHEVSTFDIKSFYPSVQSIFVRDFFRDKLKCAPDVATLLANLCTFKNALATGSPLSPLLSFFANFDMFEALNRVALSNGLIFTCYIDDLAFSGPKIPGDLESQIKSIIRRYGHTLASDKTIRYKAYSPKMVTGCILHNDAVHVPHSRFRKARALAAAIVVSKDTEYTLKLRQKLTGLLGEAAYLDKRFAYWKNNEARLLKLAAASSK